jgi:hypothetical protein
MGHTQLLGRLGEASLHRLDSKPPTVTIERQENVIRSPRRTSARARTALYTTLLRAPILQDMTTRTNRLLGSNGFLANSPSTL